MYTLEALKLLDREVYAQHACLVYDALEVIESGEPHTATEAEYAQLVILRQHFDDNALREQAALGLADGII